MTSPHSKPEQRQIESGAYLASYDGLELELPNGRVVRGKVPPLKKALHFLHLADRMGAGDKRALSEIVRTFPKAVKLEKELNELTIAEFLQVFDDFFGLRRSRDQGPKAQTPPTENSEPTSMI